MYGRMWRMEWTFGKRGCEDKEREREREREIKKEREREREGDR